jgi:hypothetical protein
MSKENHAPTPQEEKITITPSSRIDYCSNCGEEHGYDCPKDTPTSSEGWEERFDKEFVQEGVSGQYVQLTMNSAPEVKAFIAAEITAAEGRGRKQGIIEESNDCYKHCEQARTAALEEIRELLLIAERAYEADEMINPRWLAGKLTASLAAEKDNHKH